MRVPEPRYQLRLTLQQLYTLKEQMTAAADPGHRDAGEQALLELIEATHRRALAERKRVAECVHDYGEFIYGAFCVKCGQEEPAAAFA
ncbi:hypothetical protein [Pseudomonas nitroreducens]|uniref:hypothetical protein n=1 Tax=Pseudomonas nitroreducens TaxID=46680 RepID=UPI00265AA3C8|nr:hypothetical protein [Pseudomonas nitroreducens]MCP1652717.1 hypothetical protein [Pseudomonas nitroreducens]